MNAPNKGAMALEIRTESGQQSLKARHASRKASINLIDTGHLLVVALTFGYDVAWMQAKPLPLV